MQVLPQAWWVDALIAAIFICYAIDGVRRGFFLLFFELLGFALSLFFALLGYAPLASRIEHWFGIPHAFGNALAFFALWVVVGALYPLLARRLFAHIPQRIVQHPLHRWLGIFPAFGDALLLCAVILPLLVALPLSAPVKTAVLRSRLGSPIVRAASLLDEKLSVVYSPIVREGLAFLTVHPQSEETVPLKFRASRIEVDEESEIKLFTLVNNERKKRGLPLVVFDTPLRALARLHAADMLERSYFSHVSPDGKTPSGRADAMHIRYRIMGENLAFAPDVLLAHDGLMNSPGHRANILSEAFGHMGIGVYDAGMYGKMFVQEFSE